ncbi:TBC domain-containing protein [Cyclospora cayetanensis]|uniref:TBC domain-containing protein n=1 Tax=Cyclospora cayetanensis TaxID=88456 RepID=A0A1D3CSK6_9EIME|nr:TBC domain-containing protein [Cyclospora cayetanensis]
MSLADHASIISLQEKLSALKSGTGSDSDTALRQRLDSASVPFSLTLSRTATKIESQTLSPNCEDEAAKRIFALDAERTFKSPECRGKLVEVLSSLWPELGDYHQGLGFVVSFLLLVLPPTDVLRVCIGLHREYMPGYFKAAPVAYVRDARVFQKMLNKREPEVGAHLEDLACAEAYASKWFVGLNVHVLTFEALFVFLEGLLETGDRYLFQFAFALIANCKEELLNAKNAADVLEILRLDVARYTNKHKATGEDADGSFFMKIVKDAKGIVVETEELEKLREEAMEDLRMEQERRKQRDKEEAPKGETKAVAVGDVVEKRECAE